LRPASTRHLRSNRVRTRRRPPDTLRLLSNRGCPQSSKRRPCRTRTCVTTADTLNSCPAKAASQRAHGEERKIRNAAHLHRHNRARPHELTTVRAAMRKRNGRPVARRTRRLRRDERAGGVSVTRAAGGQTILAHGSNPRNEKQRTRSNNNIAATRFERPRRYSNETATHRRETRF
jgi:hypothetical protein